MEERKWGRKDRMRYSQRWIHPFIPFQQSLGCEKITWWLDRAVNVKRITRACRKLEDSGNGTFDVLLNLVVTVNRVKLRREFKLEKVIPGPVVHAIAVPGLCVSLISHKVHESTGRRRYPFEWMRTKCPSERRTSWHFRKILLVSAPPKSPYFWIQEDVKESSFGIFTIFVPLRCFLRGWRGDEFWWHEFCLLKCYVDHFFQGRHVRRVWLLRVVIAG